MVPRIRICTFLTTILILGIGTNTFISAQSSFVFTKSFDKKLRKYQLEFYEPVESWLKPTPLIKDDFMKYDIVFHNPPSTEIRIAIDKDHRRLYPNVEITRILSHISSNSDDTFIELTQYPARMAKERYGADLVLYADFTPKYSFATHRNGRLLFLYKEGKALVKYIILYEDDLDPFFKLPIRFTDNSQEEG